MLNDATGFEKVYIACGRTDLRRGIDGLAFTYKDRPIILYDYERTRKAEHPQEFLKGFKGVVVTDGYSAYQKMDKENPDIVFAGYYAHCHRKFSDVSKGLK